MRAQKPKGSVVYNKTRATWNFLWVEDRQRKSRKLGTLAQLPTKADALRKVEAARRDLRLQKERAILTVSVLVEQYRREKMPRRAMTRQGYNTWLNQYIVPKWGSSSITELQARPVDLWLKSLHLSPKSKVHIRGLVRMLWDFAMYVGEIPTQRNPMELITIEGATKRRRKPRSLTVDEFHKLLHVLPEPFRTIALVCVCFGLRISECLALKWLDVNWLNSTISVQRRIVHQVVDDVKTEESQQMMYMDSSMLEVLKRWKRTTEFPAPEDWMFASPVQIGRLPFSYAGIWQALRKGAARAGVGHLSSHVFRHTHRSWLDAVGTPIGVQQRLMRHADIRTTMNVYGTADVQAMRQAHSRVVRLAVPVKRLELISG